MLIGLGWRAPLAGWIATRPAEADVLEITAEHFYGRGGEDRLRRLRDAHPLMVHAVGLSLGTIPPDRHEEIGLFEGTVRAADPMWISEHASFTRAGGVDLGHLVPLPLRRVSADRLGDHARRLAERCGKPLLLENVTSHLPPEGEISEPEFLNYVASRSGCGLLIDATNLFINSRNHGYDAREWMAALRPGLVRQFHVAGYSLKDGRLHDAHAAPIQDDLMDFIREAAEILRPEAVTLERDANLGDPAEIASELRKLRRVLGRE